MRIVMRCDRVWQNAGREVILKRGDTHDVPDAVAQAFVATGAAGLVGDHTPAAPAVAMERAPETKPAFPPERASGRRPRR